VEKIEPAASFTLFWQMIGYWQVMFEALNKFPAEVIVDTMGVGFSYPLIKLIFGLKIVSYTHYPTISSDMLKQTDTV
jgi:alpha-1,2-mannosyltransferase